MKKEFNIVDALLSLRPGSQWTSYGNHYNDLVWHEPSEEDGGQPKPTIEEIEKEIERLKEEYDYNQYQRDRVKAYPSIEDQLDLLYHGGYDAWKEEINKVKEEYPKPEGL